MRPVIPRPPGRCLSPTPANVYPLTGIGSCKSLLEHRATARQGNTRIIMLVNSGGTATQPRAPGADIPPATTAGAPGQYCQSAAHLAPGHERPRAALRAARHGRPSAAPRAPGADVPPATTAEAPGQYRLCAAHRAPDHCRSRPVPKAPGHGRPRAASSDVVRPDRLRATLRAPGADVPLATVAGAPGQHRLRAVANATVALPAGQHRPRQEGLPRVPANPRILTHPHFHHTASSFPRQRRSGHVPTNAVGAQPVAPVPPQDGGTTGGLNGSPSQPAAVRRPAPSPGAGGGGGGGRPPRPTHHPTHQVQPAIQGLPHPRPCATADTGFLRQHPSHAPPPPAPRLPLSTWWRGGRGVRPPSPTIPRTPAHAL